MKQEIILVVMCAFLVEAQVVIEQAYPNPVGTESGGEAVLLRNRGNGSVNLENWTLATQASPRDVIFPAMQLAPQATFLVADIGWKQKRDDPLWRDADLEDTLTLGNDNSGVALIDFTGKTLDALGWGQPSTLFTGTPAPLPSEGKALIRRSLSGDNARDFVVADPEFDAEDVIVIVVHVVNTTVTITNVSVMPDDDNAPGVQILPGIGKRVLIRVIIEGFIDSEVTATLANQTIELEAVNESTYEGTIPLTAHTAAGIHVIDITAGNARASATFEYLPRKKLSVQNQVVLSGSAGRRMSGVVLVRNEGNTPLALSLLLINSSWATEVSMDGVVFKRLQDVNITIAPGQSINATVAVAVPSGTKPGTYKTRMKLREI